MTAPPAGTAASTYVDQVGRTVVVSPSVAQRMHAGVRAARAMHDDALSPEELAELDLEGLLDGAVLFLALKATKIPPVVFDHQPPRRHGADRVRSRT